MPISKASFPNRDYLWHQEFHKRSLIVKVQCLPAPRGNYKLQGIKPYLISVFNSWYTISSELNFPSCKRIAKYLEQSLIITASQPGLQAQHVAPEPPSERRIRQDLFSANLKWETGLRSREKHYYFVIWIDHFIILFRHSFKYEIGDFPFHQHTSYKEAQGSFAQK